jgi:hypothetical protein
VAATGFSGERRVVVDWWSLVEAFPVSVVEVEVRREQREKGNAFSLLPFFLFFFLHCLFFSKQKIIRVIFSAFFYLMRLCFILFFVESS